MGVFRENNYKNQRQNISSRKKMQSFVKLYLLVHALNSYFSSRLITLVGFSSVTRWKIRSNVT